MTWYTFIFKKGRIRKRKQFFCASEREAWSKADEWAYDNGFDDYWRE